MNLLVIGDAGFFRPSIVSRALEGGHDILPIKALSPETVIDTRRGRRCSVRTTALGGSTVPSSG